MEKSLLDTKSDDQVASVDSDQQPDTLATTVTNVDWSRSSPSKKMSESSVTSCELQDMACVLDRSAGAGDKSLQEVNIKFVQYVSITLSLF